MRIKAPSRIHITLVDLNGAVGRVDGGVGLTLESPGFVIRARKNDEIRVEGEAEFAERGKAVLEKFQKKFGYGLEVVIERAYPSHIGLGSGTQLALSVGKAYCLINGIGLSVREIAELAGRGGTSGIGVAAFEYGGFIVDGGHTMKEKKSFLPSSFSRAKPAPVIARHDFPDWDVYLIIPDEKGFAGMRERHLFEKNTPVSLHDVRELAHIILMKLLPAVAEHDLDEFANAIHAIQYLGFKRAEVSQYGTLIFDLIEVLRDYGAAGMSSTGPTVYFVGDRGGIDAAKSYFKEREIGVEIVKTKARNRGAEVEI
ncbi:beta-ribofuranosylaminobenzene 5'-phosphate synthase [Geoglobus acetivorans]|uniref:Beta-ribofuranosylaminobenzene 5'-phosphate synthase n=1 Tax=Geoglobus acetivorans TaxID=565033 RepID=A0ABZ3H528_GEOAI|nr:hypothetical protein [Geoglobus acetivorans]